ncbi:MAG: hypothetical protein GC162_10710 [Planctomycetes bacterium]|nr:hypothetical protein [Planctomycetota bacterium]
MRRRLLIIVILVALAPVTRAGEPVWFDELPATADIAPASIEAMTRAAWAKLAGDPPVTLAPNDEPRIIFLSVSEGTHPAVTVSGSGQGDAAALDAAMKKLGESKRQVRWLRIDVVDRVKPRGSWRDAVVEDFDHQRDGLAFGSKPGGLALLNIELTSRPIMDERMAIVPAAMLAALKPRPDALKQFNNLWIARPLPIYRFDTRGGFFDGRAYVPLIDGTRADPPLDPDALLNIAVAGGAYLTRSVDDKGRFVYLYDAAADRVPEEYNLIRHAGAVYAMVELYQVTHDKALIAAAKRAIDYLITQTLHEKTPDGLDLAFLVEDHRIALGTNGLTLLSLAQYMIATGDRTLMPVAQSLANWIKLTQAPDGRFTIYEQRWPDRLVFESPSLYAAGEAMLGLLRLHQLTRDDSLIDAALRGARYLAHQQADIPLDKLDHDHWLMYAFNELAMYRRDNDVERSMGRLVEAILTTQHGSDADPLWVGGWYDPPRSTPAATRVEGLGAAWRIDTRLGDKTKAAALIAPMLSSVRYQMRTWMGPEKAMFFADPPRVLGAFSGAIDNFEIRNDFVQHNVSSLLALRGILMTAK